MEIFSFNFKTGKNNIPVEKIVNYSELNVDYKNVEINGKERTEVSLPLETFLQLEKEGKILYTAEFSKYMLTTNGTSYPISIVRMDDGNLEVISYGLYRKLTLSNIHTHNNYKNIPYKSIIDWKKTSHKIFNNLNELLEYYGDMCNFVDKTQFEKFLRS